MVVSLLDDLPLEDRSLANQMAIQPAGMCQYNHRLDLATRALRTAELLRDKK